MYNTGFQEYFKESLFQFHFDIFSNAGNDICHKNSPNRV